MERLTPFWIHALLLAVGTWRLTSGQINLLDNPSFEEPLGNTWKPFGECMVARWTDDTYDGDHALRVYHRTDHNEGVIFKKLEVNSSSYYEFEMYTKLLNQTGLIWESMKVIFSMNLNGTIPHSYVVARHSFLNVSSGWTLVKGSIRTPDYEFNNTKLSMRGPSNYVEFLIDKVSLVHVPNNDSWRAAAETNMHNHRKSDINLKTVTGEECYEVTAYTYLGHNEISVNLPAGATPSDFSVQVLMKKHLYPFGAMMRVSLMLEEPMNDVTKMGFDWFNWVTIQNYKWKYNKGKPENLINDFSEAVNATNLAIAHGLKVRGHAIFWDMAKAIPEWVLALSKEEKLSKLHEHLEYMINLARGKLQEWDIMNESPPGLFYEEELHKPDVTKELFQHAAALQDSAKLYLNNFQCVTSGGYTEILRTRAMEFLAENIPIHGLGCQGHSKDYMKPDPTAMWRRIDRLAETGLEIKMTEFDVPHENQLVRADYMEDAMRGFFGHPKMTGVILWDWWNETMSKPNKGLMEGPNRTIVEAGERWYCLVKKEWVTNETFNMTDSTNVVLRGFHGDYQVVVRRNDVPVQVENFVLPKTGATWNLDVTDSQTEVEVPTAVDYVPQCISHRDERSIGAANSSTDATSLTCRTVYSGYSGLNEDDVMSVTCDADEVMTDCFSYHKDKSWTRKGEVIEVNSTTVTCLAYNGRDSSNGVRAYARCCKVAGLTCDYKTAGPSYVFDGAMAEARCDTGDLALGCSTYSTYPDSDGVRNKDDLSTCIAQSGKPAFTEPTEKSGALVFSVCCKAQAQLNCTLVVSSPSKPDAGVVKSVSCPSGYVMTGCSSYADGGKSGGARIWGTTEESCKAYLGADLPAGSTGVRAYATCCRID